mmetsp:Transcript_22744/g.46277  ORF Transcript_22744/g.46277 Transcript_22744/m.46277 type:complete len:90 (-) Transcript_22744:965-1234(-)
MKKEAQLTQNPWPFTVVFPSSYSDDFSKLEFDSLIYRVNKLRYRHERDSIFFLTTAHEFSIVNSKHSFLRDLFLIRYGRSRLLQEYPIP